MKNKFNRYSGFLTWFMALLLSALAVGCGGGGGGGRDPIFGGGVELAPIVTAVAPLPNATGVPINTKIITAAFSKAMDPATLTTASFTLACPAGTPIAGAVSYLAAGNVASLTLPAATSLPVNTLCTATVTTAAKDTVGNALPSNFSWTFTTGAAIDLIPPTVSSTSPLANATGVALNTLIAASFSEPMDPLTITATNVKLACPAGTAVTGTVAYVVNGNVATLTPAANLPASTVCTATTTTGVKDVAGNTLVSPFTWNFTTGVAPDTTPPTVSSTVPLANATGVPLNTLITASFSEAMDPLTITAASVKLACPAGTTVTGIVGYAVNGSVATLTPAATLPASTICTGTITTAVKDVAGNAMAGSFTWNFTTGAAPDTTPPTVSSTVPLSNATGVALNSLITASFSEPMDPLTITTASIKLACPTGTAITGTVGYASIGNVATLTPVATLPANTICTATITTAVKDVAGNAMVSLFTWNFTTGAAPDTTPPTVSSTGPLTNASGVALNSLITARFSEPMDPLTITAASVKLACPAGTAVTGIVGYAVNGNLATLTPAANLPASTICTATITTAVKDVAGNAMANPYTWNFTTGAAADTTPPTVSSTVPLANASGVPLNTLITASFSEPMDPLSITTASVQLACPTGTAITGTVGYASIGNVATLTPAASLPASTICTATITTAVKDVAGNAMASAFTWNFTTGAAPDTTRPTVSSTVPLANALGVPLNTLITANFSEPMDPLTITNASVQLACPAGTPITGIVGYAVNGNVATLTPAAALPASTICTATITTAVKDVAGNAMANPFTWIFTTGAALDVTPPTVILVNPANLAIDVPINTAVNATFSEAMDPLSITTASFTLQVSGPPLGPVLVGTIDYNVLSHIATLTPSLKLTNNTQYTATVTTGTKDLAGNALVTNYVWTFTTATAGSALAPGAVPLGSASTFGIMATSAITNTGLSNINGDVSLDPGTSMTGFPPGVVNGAIHINDTVSAQARADLLVAYNFAKGLAPGTTISAGADLGALYPSGIAPGTYTSGSTMLVSTPLTLDAGGNANAVWVFQIGSSLTTGASVSLANGAQAKNVFWVPTSDATIGVGTIFYGTIVAGRDVTAVTGATVNGRILAGAITAGTIALQTSTVNVPAP